MVGLLVVTHRDLAQELIATAELIVGEIDNCVGLSVQPDVPVDDLRRQMHQAIDQVNSGDGVIVLTDMFGGTPSNLSLSFLNQQGIEVVTGVNLPMLIKLATARQDSEVGELAKLIKDYGRRSISLASEILEGGPES
ncbi:MAG: PTS sugar transporter subunit IIA [Deltaproteobacteria bacterium]|nr:PTS sugar transporter subunit IIA [Deltaproteobacteria bacterium]MBW2070512.1 PTS sugar transporter subunit IIA [Deltaproteobacteria bacterium]